MRAGQPLLLPASPVFIWISLLVALLLNMVPNVSGRATFVWMPDFLAVTLVFWNIHQPRRVGVGVAFMFGLFMDVHQTALLGQHALCYTVLSYLAIVIHRRLLWFTAPSQALQVLPLFITSHALELLVRMSTGGMFPGALVLLSPLLEATLWPLVSIMLLLPQRRPPDPDKHRPL